MLGRLGAFAHLRAIRALAALDAALLVGALLAFLAHRPYITLSLVLSHGLAFALMVVTTLRAVSRRTWRPGMLACVAALGPAAALPAVERRWRITDA
jgi:hypothetical protein